MSIWEAQAERRADTVQAKAATAESLENRQRIQQEATASRRIHSLETKRLEKQRQLDLQRGEIHPSHVQAQLQDHDKQQPSAPSSRQQTARMLPPAVPQDDPPGRPIVPLPVRKRRRDDDS